MTLRLLDGGHRQRGRGERSRRVMLVDDHHLIRQGLRILLEGHEGIHVVADVGDAEEALRVLESTECDYVLMDVNLPGHDGLWALEQIRARWPGLPVLMVTMAADGAAARRAFDLGARAYVLKTSTLEGLLEALDAVEQGNSYVCPRVLTLFLETLQSQRPTDPLTQRERDVMDQIGKGLSNEEVGRNLHLSLSTVKTHLRSMYAKLGTNRAGLVAEAVRRDLA